MPISGHLDDWINARTTDDILGKVETPINAAVGIVIPAEAIRQTLELEELIEERAIRRQETGKIARRGITG